MTDEGKRKALIIAVSEYDEESRLPHLPFCRNDGIAIYDILAKQGYDIPADRKLVGNVGGAKLRKQVLEFFRKSAKKDDTLFFYFSGHGISDSLGDHHLASSDINKNIPEENGLGFVELEKMMKMSEAKSIVLVLDCCFAGAIGLGSKGEEEAANNARGEMYKVFAEGNGRCIFASSLEGQSSYSMKGSEYSLFTHYLLEGLKGGNGEAVDEDGYVTPVKLSNYVYGKIPLAKQKPITKYEMSGDIVIAEYPKLAKRNLKHVSQEAEVNARTITANVDGSSLEVNPGETLIINPGIVVKLDSLNNNGTVIVMGSLRSNSQFAQFASQGVIVVLPGGSVGYEYPAGAGTFTNHKGGLIIVNTGASFALNINNHGIIKHYGSSLMTFVKIMNEIGAEIQNHGSLTLEGSTFSNKGIIVNGVGSSTFTLMHGGLLSSNDGGQIINNGQFSVGKSMGLENVNGGIIINNPGAVFQVGFIESGAGLTNDLSSTMTNSGTIVASYLGAITNHGIFNNNYAGPGTGILKTVSQGGDVHGTEGSYVNAGTMHNNTGATIDNQGHFIRISNDVFNNNGTFTGNPVIHK